MHRLLLRVVDIRSSVLFGATPVGKRIELRERLHYPSKIHAADQPLSRFVALASIGLVGEGAPEKATASRPSPHAQAPNWLAMIPPGPPVHHTSGVSSVSER